MITDVYIGFDDREPKGYSVAKYSIEKHTSYPIKVHPLIQSELRQKGIYTRRKDELASTQFSLTRFLVPTLMKHKGYALFMDSDMLITRSFDDLNNIIDKTKAVSVVKHDYTPKTTMKMDGQVQHVYPKKNWSSFIVFNCSHPYNKQLNPNLVNSQSPSFLHQFQWLTKNDIGNLPFEYNYLVGEYDPWKPTKLPLNLHWTLGSPELLGNDIAYADIWNQYYEESTKPIISCDKQPSSVAKIKAEVNMITKQLEEEADRKKVEEKILEMEHNTIKKNWIRPEPEV